MLYIIHIWYKSHLGHIYLPNNETQHSGQVVSTEAISYARWRPIPSSAGLNIPILFLKGAEIFN